MRTTRYTIAAATIAFSFGLAMAKNGNGVNFCKVSTQDALKSCRQGAMSDLSLAQGICENLSDNSARKACKQQAMADHKDAFDSCSEERDARLSDCDRLGPDPYDPVIDPANFVSTIDNPYLPMIPGTTYIYEGPSPDGFEHNEVAVTHNTRVILGVTCVEVHDTVTLDGVLVEDTRDWFAQDKDGAVWYMGENSAELEGGLPVSLEGSWEGGVDGGKPGIIMQAHPAVGQFYRQEFLLGTAEDLAEVLSLTESETVTYGSFTDVLETAETTPMEPDALEHKFYAPGIGAILDIDLESGEMLQLIAITTE